MLSTPILYLAYNRSDFTKQSFSCIRKIKPKKLYLAVDGPKDEKDRLEIEKVKVILTTIDWKCEVKTLYRDNNLGCGKAVSEAISWFFEHEEKGVILEDDCIPTTSFFTFCEEMLSRYEDNEQVMHIAGSSFIDTKTDHSYVYSTYSLIWGWATWRSAWKRYSFKNTNLRIIDQHNQLSDSEKLFFKDKAISVRTIDTWDYQWQLSIWKHNGVCIIPNQNLVSNIGFDERASHTIDPLSLNAFKPTVELRPIKHPERVSINRKYDKLLFDTYHREKGTIIRQLKNKLIKWFPSIYRLMK
ncbi:MAG: nucleotide-diphospho-sugar transferase [Cyclobacteriaceae bacterium]